MNHWKPIIGVGVVLAGLGTLLVWTNPDRVAFETFAIEQVKTELCPQVPLGLDKQCPRMIDENQPALRSWVRENTQTRNYGLFTQYETTLSIRKLVPEVAQPFLSMTPLPQKYRLQTIGILGRFIIYGTQSQR